jgi:predicted ATPase
VEKQRKVLKIRQAGTGDWLSQNEDYNAWKNSTQSSVLSIFGIPGSGKTILTSSIIDILQEGVSERVVVIHHYCDYKDPRSLDPIIVAGTLISGLLASLDITDDISTLITYAYQDGQRSPDEHDIRQILDSVLDLRLDRVIYMVLDGVDEVQEQDRKLLLNFMKHFMECKHSLLKLMVTSRADISGAICQPRT